MQEVARLNASAKTCVCTSLWLRMSVLHLAAQLCLPACRYRVKSLRMSSAGLHVCRVFTPFLEAGFIGKHVCAWLHGQGNDTPFFRHLDDALSTVSGNPFKQHLEPTFIKNIDSMLKEVLPHP